LTRCQRCSCRTRLLAILATSAATSAPCYRGDTRGDPQMHTLRSRAHREAAHASADAGLSYSRSTFLSLTLTPPFHYKK
jgi:hypothetical protein